jgi:3'-phosphoadenosine 5'-phosphosulfate sulfotransferase (PAPS reductase)/FAD synthetase
MKILVSWSGGKDSQACLIEAAKKYGAANITAVFCDTGWEHPVTYFQIPPLKNRIKLQDIASMNGVKAKKNINTLLFDLSKYTYPKKEKLLRNCVDPLIGKAILEKVIDINTHNNIEQRSLFNQ